MINWRVSEPQKRYCFKYKLHVLFTSLVESSLGHIKGFLLLYLQHFRGLSFPTISSVGPNAAIIHYGPRPETCAEFDPDSIYLFDSGAQVGHHDQIATS